MRRVDTDAIRTHGAVRFRSDYHYAVFEYWRSAKMLRCLERAGVRELGRVLDDGCGGGGMAVSVAEETTLVVGIDPVDRFRDAGERLAREQRIGHLAFSCADGTCLPFRDAAFDVVLSHAVIEHVADPATYLREAHRVLRPGGTLFLQTAPALSPHGSHLPRLKVPVPLHLLVGRRLAYASCWWLARHAPRLLDVPSEGSSFLTLARAGVDKPDDLFYRVTVANLRRHIADAGFRRITEDLYLSGLFTRLVPKVLSSRITAIPLVRDIVVTNMEYVLTKS